MIHIETKHSFTTLSCLTRLIIFNEWEYDTFKENLFVLEGKNRTQINPEDLKFGDFQLLFYKHIPNYNDETQIRLDIEHLLQKCYWTTTENYKLSSKHELENS
jgi:hypothetical protein